MEDLTAHVYDKTDITYGIHFISCSSMIKIYISCFGLARSSRLVLCHFTRLKLGHKFTTHLFVLLLKHHQAQRPDVIAVTVREGS